jgi:hypothetical protein
LFLPSHRRNERGPRSEVFSEETEICGWTLVISSLLANFVHRANKKRAVGYLGRASIMAARERYHRDEQLRQHGLRKAELIELQSV